MSRLPKPGLEPVYVGPGHCAVISPLLPGLRIGSLPDHRRASADAGVRWGVQGSPKTKVAVTCLSRSQVHASKLVERLVSCVIPSHRLIVSLELIVVGVDRSSR